MWWKRGLVMVTGALAIGAVGCASGGGSTAPAPETRTMEAELGSRERPVVLIQVNPDCTVDKDEAHVSESKKEEAHWNLVGSPGPLVIAFKLEKGQGAFDIAQVSNSESSATIKAKEYGPHPYRITIDDKECPDPVLIIDP